MTAPSASRTESCKRSHERVARMPYRCPWSAGHPNADWTANEAAASIVPAGAFRAAHHGVSVGPTIVSQRSVGAFEGLLRDRRLRAAGHTLVAAISGVLGGGCSVLVDEHILTVRNESTSPVSGLVVGIKTRQVAVDRLEPDASTIVRIRLNAESHWDVYRVVGSEKKHLGTCGYTGTTPGRPTENTLRLVSHAEGQSRDYKVSVQTEHAGLPDKGWEPTRRGSDGASPLTAVLEDLSRR